MVITPVRLRKRVMVGRGPILLKIQPETKTTTSGAMLARPKTVLAWAPVMPRSWVR